MLTLKHENFFTFWLGTQWSAPENKSIPPWLARMLASAIDGLFALFKIKKQPLITTAAFLVMGEEVIINHAKARRFLRYKRIVAREDERHAMRASIEKNFEGGLV